VILSVLFGLLILAVALLLAGRRLLSVLLIFLMLLLVGLTGTAPLPARLLTGLQQPFLDLPSPDWGRSNAIVLLGAGTVKLGDETNPSLTGYGRIERAVSAWRDCKAGGHECIIVVSGGDPNRKGFTEAEVFADSLIALGVAESDILRDAASRNTFENARFTRQLLADRDFDRVFLVTSGFHMQRSLLFFRHFGLDARPLPALMLQPTPTLLPRAVNIGAADAAVHEYLGLLRYRFYNALGWNPEPAAPPPADKTLSGD